MRKAPVREIKAEFETPDLRKPFRVVIRGPKGGTVFVCRTAAEYKLLAAGARAAWAGEGKIVPPIPMPAFLAGITGVKPANGRFKIARSPIRFPGQRAASPL